MRTHTSQLELVPLAVQHYVAGRMLALQLQTHVAGNILHHAVELFIKAELARVVSIDELKNKYRHNLKKLWRKYATMHTDSPGGFLDTVTDLDAFEEIRYPSAEKESIAHHYSLFKDSAGRRMGAPGAYSLTLESIDELVAFIASKPTLRNSYAFNVAQLPPFSRAVLLDNNRHRVSHGGA